MEGDVPVWVPVVNACQLDGNREIAYELTPGVPRCTPDALSGRSWTYLISKLRIYS